MTITPEAANAIKANVNKQNLYTVGAGGGIGTLGGIITYYRTENSTDSAEDVVVALAGALFAQASTYFLATRIVGYSKNSVLKYIQKKVLWASQTPLPAIIGAVSFIGVRYFMSSK